MNTPPLTPRSVTGEARTAHRFPAGVAPAGFLLLAMGLLWIVPAWIEPRALIGMGIWDGLIAAAWVIDLKRLRAGSGLRVTRSWDGAPTLDVESTVRLTVSNAGSDALRVWMLDAAPPVLRSAPPEVERWVPASGTATTGYIIRPQARGDVHLGVLTMRCRSRWNIAVRWAIVPLEQTVRVYPNLEAARRHTLYLMRARQTDVEKRRARRWGTGREFESLRDYRDGDELRDISWRVSARRGRMVTKVFQPERSQTVWMLIDGGRLLRGRVESRTKLDHAVDAALALAHVALTSGDRVGLLAYGRRIHHRLAPARGALHMRALVEALATVQPEGVEANHMSAASLLSTIQKRRALVVWLTDVAETAAVPDVIESAGTMTSRHLVLFAAMRHVPLAVLAHETPDTAEEMYRVIAAQEVLDRRAALLHGLRQRGALALDLAPQELASALVDRYLAIKERSEL